MKLKGIFTLFIILTLSAVMLSSSCGLYSYPYISPPDVRTVSITGGNAIIINTGDNDPDVFRGYEIYYKFYNQSTAANDQRNDHNQIFNKLNDDAPKVLTAAGYRRVRTEKNTRDDTLYPMISVPAGSKDNRFDLIINFSPITTNGSKEELKIRYLGTELSLYRDVVDQAPDTGESPSASDTVYKDFNSDDLQYTEYQDGDLPSGDVSLSMYVFSYGIHENIYNLYSTPVWLGYVNCW